MIRINKYRPSGFTGKGDRLLPQLAKELSGLLIETEESLDDCSVSFSAEEWDFIAEILVDFAEDMHNEIGIWDSYESYNLELFGTPLPLTLNPGIELEQGTIDTQRIFHLLWVLYHEMYPGTILSPHNYDLSIIADEAEIFLLEKFENVPRSSGVKQYLIQPIDYGWDVKLKLVWFGMNSYMFRIPYSRYMLENLNHSYIKANDQDEVYLNIIDDFICTGTTCWSGLGAIDLLAGVLDITEEEQDELRVWYERNYGFFRVLAVKDNHIEMLNIINEEIYTVKVGKKELRFYKTGTRVWGYLLKWDNEWIWSGRQSTFDNLSKEENEKMIEDFILEFPDMDKLYYKEKIKLAREEVKKTIYKF